VDTSDELNQIIELSKAVLERKIDPLKLNVRELLEKIDAIFPKLKDIEEHLKDVEAMHGIANILHEQTHELNYRSEIMYLSPEAMIEKIKKMDPITLANILILCLNPVLSTSYLSTESLLNAIEYWYAMSKKKEQKEERSPNVVSINLEELGIIGKESLAKIEELAKEITSKTPINLKEMLAGKSYEEKIQTLYFLAYLISNGSFILKEIDDEIFVDRGKSSYKGSIIIEASKWAKE